jgi:hypothetical protein
MMRKCSMCEHVRNLPGQAPDQAVCGLACSSVATERGAEPRHAQDKLRPSKCGPDGRNYVERAAG